ncbi:MAG: hypothetical protein A2509_06655 [Candidatus Edwardsbacteria bacterium RIFOXYD12_FULL_50_11]|uniref:AsmA domain-containing protein n=1 Tax=Candidatus Edwardsbacteria bacterium GWF2_54_11 TaxID=1817851 RepID=A0A1F5R4F3_9BACT|nr:MAG: hypothetical protein A2502_09960 [Candidatus Edwardsbacteria bacterium RifOxyC12_full_54_24]OGF06836.1 MAG: hypothetical protein A2273_01100 [Candidatus Edwardsbacteria bacterium RifOxyA12_full_54_48]OGF08903.1 MAG: hypothetical protein A2024_01360 [Candidatus Edwardsbacteria bacterium GWF2_54_11]OGF10786.1 MAG: hypothetical protein A3K15_06465 [Candidatus Edwardsbacteria bacterium GWE2_54_12]OGF15566.1 MAG: hypothetical protein A2509_06655 [Candidatus Edwardsbacteria bacterium RIFOXYD1
MNKFLKISLIVLAVFVFIFIAAGITLKIMFPPAKLRALLMPRIEQAVGRPVKVESFSLKVWTGLGVQLKGIELANAQDFGQQPMVSIESVTLKINLLALLKRQLAVTSLTIDKPTILIEKSTKGAFNFDDLIKAVPVDSSQKAPPPGSSPVSIAVQSFRINDGSFIFEDKQLKMRVEALGINEQLRLDADAKLENIHTTGWIKVKEIRTTMPGISLSRIYLNVDHDISLNLPKAVVTINRLTVAPQGIALTLAGTVSDFDSLPVLDLALQTTAIDMKQIFAAIPPEFKAQAKDVHATGKVELGLKITGQIDPQDPKSKPKVDGMVGLRNIGIKYAMLPKSISDVNGEITFTENDLDIKKISAKLGTAGFEMSCLVRNFEDPYIKAAFKGNFDLGEVKEYVPLEEGLTLAGKIKADFKVDGKVNDINTFNMDGRVDIEKISLATKALMKPVTDLNGTIQLTKNLINLPDISCQIGRSSLSLTAQVKNFLSLAPEMPAAKPGQPAIALPKQGKAVITFALNSPLLDLDEMLPPLPSASAKATADKKAPVQTPPVLPPLPDFLMDGKVRIAKIKFLKIDYDNLAGNLSINDRKLNLDGQVGIYSGKVLGSLWSDLNDLTKIEYQLKAQASQLEANDFLSALTPFKDRMFTKLDINGEFSGLAPDTILIKKTLKGSGSARTGEGKIINWDLLAKVFEYTKLTGDKDLTFKSLSTGFRILNERLYLDDLKLDSRFGDANLTGSSGFDGTLDYRVSIKLTKEESDKLRARSSATSLFSDKDGRMVLDLLVKGPAQKPSIGWDTQMAQARLKGKAQEELDKAKAQAQAEADKAKKAAEDKARKEAEELKKKAADKLKGIFGGH